MSSLTTVGAYFIFRESVHSPYRDVAIGDVNGDGMKDIVCIDSGGSFLWIFLNLSNCSFLNSSREKYCVVFNSL